MEGEDSMAPKKKKAKEQSQIEKQLENYEKTVAKDIIAKTDRAKTRREGKRGNKKIKSAVEEEQSTDVCASV